MDFAALLSAELTRRQAINPRYSLRAFARALGTSHTLLSRVCQRERHASAATITTCGRHLGWPAARTAEVMRAQAVDRLCARVVQRGFQADVRWLAARLGLSMDEVQLALHDALRTRRLALAGRRSWLKES